jgi:hypothetical protein
MNQNELRRIQRIIDNASTHVHESPEWKKRTQESLKVHRAVVEASGEPWSFAEKVSFKFRVKRFFLGLRKFFFGY